MPRCFIARATAAASILDSERFMEACANLDKERRHPLLIVRTILHKGRSHRGGQLGSLRLFL